MARKINKEVDPINEIRYRYGDEYSSLHRKDGPAYIRPDGHECWIKNGKQQRKSGPSMIKLDGTKYTAIKSSDGVILWPEK